MKTGTVTKGSDTGVSRRCTLVRVLQGTLKNVRKSEQNITLLL